MTEPRPTSNPLPVVRLRPKVDPRPLRRGAPWVYADQLVTDRRTRSISPGAFAILEDANRTPLGIVTVNPSSKIIARMMDRDPTAVIDVDWLTQKLTAALAMRERIYKEPYYRLIHAEGDGLPGVIIDRFGDTCVLQPNTAWSERLLPELSNAISAVTGVKNIIKNASGRSRVLEGLDEESKTLLGQAPDAPVAVTMNKAIYMADLTGGQKTGLFFDQRPNHAFAASLAQGARVLDVFSHVGGFGLAALAADAHSAVCVDGSAPALNLASEGARRMGKDANLQTRQADAFDALAALSSEGESFDLVVCDPPAFAPSKQALEAGLRAYERIAHLAAPLVGAGGYIGLCSCSHAADLAQFRAACLRGIGRAGRQASLIYTGFAGPDHPQHPSLAESGYLKSLFFRLT